jgi:ferric-dicitrate binding protein FerR (iron transport regulator)
MNDNYEKLVRDYLAGEAGQADVEELNRQVVGDRAARRELLLAAALEAQLERLMSAEPAEARPTARISRTTILCYAALLALAVGGWVLAGKLSYQLRQDSGRIATLMAQPTLAATPPVVEPQPQKAANKALEIIDTRGMVLLCGANEHDLPLTMGTGSIIPAGQNVWTCPWGGAGTRDADGTQISLDRSTVASFSDDASSRGIVLREGILSVMRPTVLKVSRPVIMKTDEATVTLSNNGQVTVVAEKGRTLVETAGGEVAVRRASDGRTVTVSAGHYAIVSGSGEVTELAGRLRWDLAP